MSIPGVNFAAWGRSYKYPDIAMHFIGTKLASYNAHDNTDQAKITTPDVNTMSTSVTTSEGLFPIH